MNRYYWLLAAFALLVVLLAVGLNLNPREVPSPFIGRAAPDFSLPILPPKQKLSETPTAEKFFSPKEMQGKVWLLNVWASWCVSCRAEHPLLVAFSKEGTLPIVGLNYKEIRGDGGIDVKKMSATDEKREAVERAQGWLEEHGNPYDLSVMDLDGRVGIDYGVYGVPETYLIDKKGIIRLKHIGPLTPDIVEKKILPLLKELNK